MLGYERRVSKCGSIMVRMRPAMLDLNTSYNAWFELMRPAMLGLNTSYNAWFELMRMQYTVQMHPAVNQSNAPCN